MNIRFALGCLAAMSLPAATFAADKVPAIPDTPKKPVVEEFHGTKVADDYRWLENWDDAAVKAWSEAQTARARYFLDRMPGTEQIRARVKQILEVPIARHWSLTCRKRTVFAMKHLPPAQQAVLAGFASDLTGERTIVDPNAMDAEGLTTIDFYVPSLDGKKVAVSLSRAGTEDGTVHVYDVATGKDLGDVVPRVNGGTAGGSVAWNADGTGFFYTRYPAPGERVKEDLAFFQQVYFHKLGADPASDEYTIGKDFPKIAEIQLESSHDGFYVLAQVANGDGGDYAFYLRGVSGRWAKVADFADNIKGAAFGYDENLYLLSRDGAPRGKIVRVSLLAPSLPKETVVPAGEAAIQGVVSARGRLYVEDIVGGPEQVRIFDLSGKPIGMLPVPAIASVGGIELVDGDDVFFSCSTYTEPQAWFRYSAATGKAERTSLAQTAPVDFSDVEVVRETATSKDGTKVPVSILRKKGAALDGKNPCLLTAYGGYGISQTPNFQSIRRVLFDQGFVLAVAHIRGGGEFGEEWHLNGNLTKKQNDYDDFYACSKLLIDSGTTGKKRLAIEGGSNGGLLMGAMLTQHPELYRAVVAHVGMFDMLRAEADPNGVFNTTEYGTVKDRAQFEALLGYSPIHRVKDGTDYPPVLFMTGANDPRVPPHHSRKMVARLQAAQPQGTFLLRTSSISGHGAGRLSERIEQQVDVLAFLFEKLGVKYQAATSLAPLPPGK